MFTLEEIATKDGLIHQGMVAYPEKPGETALVWVHGLTSAFYGNTTMLNLLARACVKRGFGFATFNNRGHDMVTGIKKKDANSPKGYSHVTKGAGREVFEESVLDIDAQIEFLTAHGYTRIVLAGHSTGANKVCFYAGIRPHKNLSGVVLLGPMSDRLDPSADKKEMQENLRKCVSLVEQGKDDAWVTTVGFFPMTAKRYVSLVSPGSLEDQFGYGDTPPTMEQYKNITTPMSIIFAERDEYADRPIGDIKKVFDSEQNSSHYHSVVIEDCLHSFAGKEKEVAEGIVAFFDDI